MAEHGQEMAEDQAERHVAVDMRVRVYPGADTESRGVVVEDFGDTAGHGVDIGSTHIADPARRWAVLLDTGSMVFVDTDDLLPE
jgi:endonuclease/exonuclease/phosphatase family metal-dependent hydrolase